MPADDVLLFIDANKYLDLYRLADGKKLLALLVEQVDYIFVPQQVVNEFQRNKTKVLVESLRNKFSDLKINIFNNPNSLINAIDVSIEQRKDIRQQTHDISQKIKQVSQEMNTFARDLIKQVSLSQDEVSKALAPIFANAVHHSSKELQRARQRKELGNPPGKNTGPIGDQLHWEQILTRFQGKKRLWIISKDSDYGNLYDGNVFLNSFLYDELCKVVPDPEVYLFEEISEGLKHFVDTTGVKAERTLSPEELEEISQEEKSLPPLDIVSEAVVQMLASSPINAVHQAAVQMLASSPINATANLVLETIEQANKESRRFANDLLKLEQADRESRRQASANLAEINAVIEEARQQAGQGSCHPSDSPNELSEESQGKKN